MSENRKLAQLMFKDNFMFGAVMADEEICRDFLEMAVGIPIEKVEISKEKSMIYHPEYHGIRLDIIARDEKRTHYNVEMQVAKKDNLNGFYPLQTVSYFPSIKSDQNLYSAKASFFIISKYRMVPSSSFSL